MKQSEYDQLVLQTFLNKQEQLFDERVAETEEEAEEFLGDSFAVVVDSIQEVREYFEENMDIDGMSEADLLEALEVFPLEDGRFLIVEG